MFELPNNTSRLNLKLFFAVAIDCKLILVEIFYSAASD